MARPIRARIDLAALRHNLQVARRRAPASKIMAVIKANAYGHGVTRAARALAAADGFALLELDAALELRKAGFAHPILLLEGCFDARELESAAQHRLAVVVHSAEQAAQLRATRLRQGLEVHIKLNTGMNRLGLAPAEFRATLEALKGSRNAASITLMTHFARAEEKDGVAAQLAAFRAITQGVTAPRSLANSAALILHPETRTEWVRPGIMLYGATPFAATSAEQLGLKPVMTLESEIIAVQDLQAGDTVGYGGAFRADRPMRIGIIACGYADGYPRHAGTGTVVSIDGHRSQLLGRVSMDMVCADLSALESADVGSPVTLWGDGVPVDEVAAAAGTVGYELLCKLAPRVPIIEIDG